MEYLTLNTGVKMPLIGYGTWKVRGEEGKQCILEALEIGYRLIDTAQMYDNEEIVGEAVKESGIAREDIFLTTKLNGTSDSYLSAKEAIDISLYRLKTDYIDLLLVHEPYDHALEMYRAMEEAVHQGKVRAIGISNYNAQQYLHFIQECRILPAVNQVESHVYYPRLALKKVLEKHGTYMQSWGSLTEGRKNIFQEPVLLNIGQKYGKTGAQIALKYLIQNGIGVIPKSAHFSRMKENMDLFDFSLSKEDLKTIDALNQNVSLFGWY